MKLLILILLFNTAQAFQKQSLFQKIRRRLQQTPDDADDGMCDNTYGEFIACTVMNIIACAGICNLGNPGVSPGQKCEAFNAFYVENKGCCVDDVCSTALEAFNECMSCSAIPALTQELTMSPTISPDPPTAIPTKAPLTGTPTRAPTSLPATASPTKKETPIPQLDLMSMSMSMDIKTPSPTMNVPLPPVLSPTIAPTQCVIPGCCVEDCCGPGTSWDSSIEYCIENSTSSGWNGTYAETDYERGCFERVCCEGDCCGSGTVYDVGIKCCVSVA
jgi:hypothetical protein